nr:hypothetical protein [Tanacetum cinerariifolium]
MESSATREYPSLIHTFFVIHAVNGVFTRDKDRAIYEEMLRLQALGSNTPSGVPYTEEEINAWLEWASSGGTFLVLVGYCRDGPQMSSFRPLCPRLNARTTLTMLNEYLTKQMNLMMKLFRSDDKFSQMLNQDESTPKFGNANGNGGCEDDEMASDEDGGENEEDEEDGDS